MRNPRSILSRGLLALGVGVASIALLAACVSTPPNPAPTQSEEADEGRLTPPADPLPLDQVAAFSGVAMVNAGSNCSGTLVDTGVDAAPAYVLTNGHCVGDVGRSPQATTLDQEWFGTVEFLRAQGNKGRTVTVEVTQLAYSTMRGTDTAFIRLDATLAELRALGISPIPIAAAEPASGDAVVNVGVPVQNLPDDQWVMRRGDCVLDAQTSIVEQGWLWHDVWANDCPGIIQGSSGSPLLRVDEAGAPTEIVGLINTTSWGVTAADGGACFINRPCQITPGGLRMVEETSYAQSVAGLGHCFDTDGLFTLADACPLPVSSIWSETAGGAFPGGNAPNAFGQLPEASLVARSAGEARTALVPLHTGMECTSAATYERADVVTVPEAGEEWDRVGVAVPAALPEDEGWYALCAVRGDDYAGAATVLFEVDRTAPIFDASADVEQLGEGAVIVRPHLDPPEISTVRFTWGAPDEVDCADTSTFQDFFIVPLTLERADLPARYCIYGLDAAGNRTEVTEIEIPAP